MAEILLALKAANEAAAFLSVLAALCHSEGRDPTDAELASARNAKKSADERWQAFLASA